MQNLLDFFEDHVPDKESNRLFAKFSRDKGRWYKAHGLFTTIRDRNLKAIKEKSSIKEAQHCFEEVCAKTLLNITRPNAPFDPDAPYWVIKNALSLATALNIPSEKIIEIISQQETMVSEPSD